MKNWGNSINIKAKEHKNEINIFSIEMAKEKIWLLKQLIRAILMQ